MKCVEMIMLKNVYLKNEIKIFQFLRYGIVGTIATGIHYGIYYILQRKINVNVAYTMGYFISFVFNFFMTTYLTFRSSPSKKRVAGFGFSHLVNYSLHMFLLNFFLFIGVSKVLAPFFVLSIAVPTNFCLLRFFFTHRNKKRM